MDGQHLTIAEYLAISKDQRPQVLYQGSRVSLIYRDPTYPDKERYVIRLASYGAGSKKPDTELTIYKE